MNASTTIASYSPNAAPPQTREDFRPHGTVLPHLPWITAVLIAPFCFGAVNGEVQVVLAVAFAISLVLASMRLHPLPASRTGKIAAAAFLLLVVVSLLPVPSLVQAISPAGMKLAERFGAEPRLSLAPGETVVRVWQLLLCGAVFVMARGAALAHRFTAVFGYGVALALLALAATEFWLLTDGKGIWREVKHYPGGTFANRNHFANWMVMGAMLVFGGLARKVRHLRRNKPDRTQIAAAALLAGALIASVSAVIACGSRGGMLALAAGLAYWVFALFRQRARGTALAVLGIALLGAAAAFGVWGELFMERLTRDALGFKWRIWQDTIALAANFPLTGIGLGAFEPIFGVFKTFHGEGAILFAENEYLHWVVETGAVGALAAGLAFFALAKRLASKVPTTRFNKAEFFHGAIAALVAFAVHASVEFTAHVMANALLAAALLGVALGLKERAAGPAVLPAPGKPQLAVTFALALIIAGLAVPQWQAAIHARGGNLAEAGESWPLDQDRAILHARRQLAQAAQGQINAQQASAVAAKALDRALQWHPYDWQLHLERSWLRISADPLRALPDALRTMDLNPLQTRLPLRYAASFARLHPPSALEILRRANYAREEQVTAALELAWSIERSPETLWAIAPANETGLRALREFGLNHRLANLAREAEMRLSGLGSNDRR